MLILLLNGIWLSSYLLIRDEQTTRGGYGSRVPYGWVGFEESFAWIRQNTAAEATVGHRVRSDVFPLHRTASCASGFASIRHVFLPLRSSQA